MLLPPDLREWVPEDDLVHFVIEAVDRLPLESFRVNHRGTGAKQFPPHMMLALLIYSYANGLFSSRKIERATHRDVAIRYLTAGTHPDHDTICKFRRENLKAFRESFVDVLELTSGREVKEPTDERLVAMRDKLRTEKGKALYGRRTHTVEPVFGIIKAVMGFRGFSLRGKEKVSGEWTLVCLAYNLKRLHGMVGSVTNGAGGSKSAAMVRKPSGISLVSDWLGEIIHIIFPQSLRLLAEFSAERALTPTGS